MDIDATKKKVKEQQMAASEGKFVSRNAGNKTGRISVRDKLLTQEVQDITVNMPQSCEVTFPDPDCLHNFILKISPSTGYWRDGRFTFHIHVPLEYNILPPKVECKTKLWHPNINEDGQVCLSILRTTSLDATGWAPTRTLKDIIWGLDSLFSDLLNFDDPLNVTAAQQFVKNKDSFIRKVRDYVYLYAK